MPRVKPAKKKGTTQASAPRKEYPLRRGGGAVGPLTETVAAIPPTEAVASAPAAPAEDGLSELQGSVKTLQQTVLELSGTVKGLLATGAAGISVDNNAGVMPIVAPAPGGVPGRTIPSPFVSPIPGGYSLMTAYASAGTPVVGNVPLGDTPSLMMPQMPTGLPSFR